MYARRRWNFLKLITNAQRAKRFVLAFLDLSSPSTHRCCVVKLPKIQIGTFVP